MMFPEILEGFIFSVVLEFASFLPSTQSERAVEECVAVIWVCLVAYLISMLLMRLSIGLTRI